MPTIKILKGLQGSGKSTYAKALVDSYPNNYKRISKDDLRAMLDNSNGTKKTEEFILKARDALILLSLSESKNVIIDDTNLNPIHEKHIRELVKDLPKVSVEVIDHFLQVPIEECIKNDLKRLHSVGEKVIRETYNKYLRKPSEVFVKEHDKNLPNALICDIDGTLAHMKDRSPYDWKRVSEDSLDETIKSLLDLERTRGTEIFIVSGRDSICREETLEWLKFHKVPFKELLMRPLGDKRSDTIVKEELYKSSIEGLYNVLYVLDDRKKVCDTWRKLGLKTFQVSEGDF